jgi:hypothetical protein
VGFIGSEQQHSPSFQHHHRKGSVMTNPTCAMTIFTLMLAAPAFSGEGSPTADDGQSALTGRMVDMKGQVLPAGSWLLRGAFGNVQFKDGTAERILLPELAIGLPRRFEFRLQEEFLTVSGLAEAESGGDTSIALLPEIRWALAAPGRIRLNPTLGLGAEIVPADADIFKVSLYLNEAFGNDWFWGSDFIYQKRVGGNQEQELIAKMGVHRLLASKHLTFGVESKFEHARTSGIDATTSQEFLLGPALMWQFHNQLVLRAGVEFGVSSQSPRSEGGISLEWRH